MSSKALRHIEINNPRAEVRACGYLARLVGPLCPRLLDGLAFERAFAHAHDAVDLASFLNEQAFRRDIAVYDAGGLDLDALVSADTAAHFPPDDRLARDYVSFHLAALPHQHLPAGAHRAHHGAFDFHDTVRADVPYDAHAGPDDGQSGFRLERPLCLLGEHRHVSSPVPRPGGDRATCPRGGFRGGGAAPWTARSSPRGRSPAPPAPSRPRAPGGARRVRTWSHTH